MQVSPQLSNTCLAANLEPNKVLWKLLKSSAILEAVLIGFIQYIIGKVRHGQGGHAKPPRVVIFKYFNVVVIQMNVYEQELRTG